MTLYQKAKEIITKQEKILNRDFVFKALPMENKRDFYKAIDAMKIFIDNLK